MTVEIYLIAVGSDGAVIGATDDGYHVRIEQVPDGEGLRSVTVTTGTGYSEVQRVHTPQIGLSRARDIISAQRRRNPQ